MNPIAKNSLSNTPRNSHLPHWQSIIAIYCSLFAVWTTSAQLIFDQQTITHEPETLDAMPITVEIPFHCANHALTLRELVVSPQYDHAELRPDKPTWRPGDTGTLVITRNRPVYRPRQVRVALQTDERQQPEPIVVKIEPAGTAKKRAERQARAEQQAEAYAAWQKSLPVLIEPAVLSWPQDGPTEPQTVKLTVPEHQPALALTGVRPWSPRPASIQPEQASSPPEQTKPEPPFTWQWKAIKPGRVFELTVTPKSTESRAVYRLTPDPLPEVKPMSAGAMVASLRRPVHFGAPHDPLAITLVIIDKPAATHKPAEPDAQPVESGEQP